MPTEEPSKTTSELKNRLRHLSIEISPRGHGLTPYQVTFTREESPPLRSMLDEGVWYCHPQHTETTIVWAREATSIPDVLTYHYGRSWSDLHIAEE